MTVENLKVYPQLVIPRNAAAKPFQEAASAYEGTVNCAPAAGAGCVNWTGAHDGVVSHHAFRVAAGDPKSNGRPRGLASSEVLAAAKSLGCDVERFYGASPKIAMEALVEGCAIQAAVDYATITKLAPALSGQPTFKKGHSLALFSFRFDDPEFGKVDTVVDHDSLFDGRHRPTYTAPQGPQTGAWSVFVQAMANFRVGSTTGLYADGKPIGAGKAIFLVYYSAAG